jgi:two-component system chemotaxis sensor kinase CheA
VKYGVWTTDKTKVDELTREFLIESLEGLDRMEYCLTGLETHPDDGELLGEIFRAVHTIKGTTGFLGLHRLEKLAHCGENLLGLLREGKLDITTEIITGLLRLLDGLRAILRLIEATGAEGKRAIDDDTELIAYLDSLQYGGPAAGTLVHQNATVPSPVAATQSAADSTLRVHVDVLNRMMNLVGELVLTRNQILQLQVPGEIFTGLSRRLDLVTGELREVVMKARMQPVGHVFSKFPRMVRDLAKTCGRNVTLTLEGQETELDKSLLEAIRDPLAHAVRNAIDHGIERPEQRLLAAKPAAGNVRLRAFHDGGYVVIEVADDGAGIFAEKIRLKALERKLITPERAAALDERALLQLVFLPGFSTAEQVTNISGRGVGMDVVRTNVEKIGGKVEIESQPGIGTTVRLRIPLTLAIIPSLVLSVEGQSFTVPQNMLVELVYLAPGKSASMLEWVDHAPVYRLRDTLLPLVWLAHVLGLQPAPMRADFADSYSGRRGLYMAVLDADGRRFGLVVEDLLEPEEIVVKPLEHTLQNAGIFSGATVLGNGSLALVIDPAALAVRAGIKPVTRDEVGLKTVAAHSGLDDGSNEFLIFEMEPGLCCAMQLAEVERIETVTTGQLERVRGSLFLQYRGEVIPLEDPGGMIHEKSAAREAVVLVCNRNARQGVLAHAVVNVAEGRLLKSQDNTGQPLVMVDNRILSVYQIAATPERSVPLYLQKEVA